MNVAKDLDWKIVAPLAIDSRLQPLIKFGENPDIDTGTLPEDVWPGGGLYPFLTTAQTLNFSSSSASDTAAGTGAQTITVFGLDANYNAISETVTLNGTSTVTTTNQYLRSFRAFVTTSGSNKTNVGEITGTSSSSSDVQIIIQAGLGQTEQTNYTVSAGHTFLVAFNQGNVIRSGTNTAGFVLVIKDQLGTERQLPEAGATSTGSSYIAQEWNPYIAIPEKTDIIIRVPNVTSNNTFVSCFYGGYLVSNNLLEQITKEYGNPG